MVSKLIWLECRKDAKSLGKISREMPKLEAFGIGILIWHSTVYDKVDQANLRTKMGLRKIVS